MCSPTAFAGAATGAQLLGQAGQARAVGKYQDQVYAANTKSANENAVLAYQQLQKRQAQEGEKAAQAIDSAHRQSALAAGRLATTLGESNIAGNTAAALLGDFRRSEAEYIQTTIRNQAFLDDQIKLEMEATEVRRRAQIMSGMSTPPAGPDYLNAGVRLGAQALAIDWDRTHRENPYAGLTG